MKKTRFCILDASAILSGKPIVLDAVVITSPAVYSEFKPGGRDYRMIQFLKEKGLLVLSPSKESIKIVEKSATKTGDLERLSYADKELLALAVEKNKLAGCETVILTDDYSIQNVASSLDIPFESVLQKGITKKFKWGYICTGCRKKFKENIKKCPICGKQVKTVVLRKWDVS